MQRYFYSLAEQFKEFLWLCPERFNILELSKPPVRDNLLLLRSYITASNNFMEMIQSHTKNSHDLRISIVIINAEAQKILINVAL